MCKNNQSSLQILLESNSSSMDGHIIIYNGYDQAHWQKIALNYKQTPDCAFIN